MSTEAKEIKVFRLQLHQPFTINGMTEQAFTASKGVDMVYTPEGVYCEYKGFRFIVPLANVIFAVLNDGKN